MSIGFKFAGTSDPRAKEIILSTLKWFKEEVKIVPSVHKLGSGHEHNNRSFTARNSLDKNTADSSMCICVLALSMVMAGSCDL